MLRSLVKPASSRWMTFIELKSILLKERLSLLQMPWLVVVWTIITLCLEVCPVSISTVSISILNTLAHVINNRKYAHATSILKRVHWLPCQLPLHVQNCDQEYLTVPPFDSSLYKSVTLAIVLLLILPRFEMIFLIIYTVRRILPLFRKSSKTYRFATKPIHYSVPVTPHIFFCCVL